MGYDDMTDDGPRDMSDERLRELYQRALEAGDAASRPAAGPGAPPPPLPGEGAAAHGPRCPSPEAMLALVRREGSEEERLETLDRVMACATCRREFDLLRAIETAGGETAAAETAAEAPTAAAADDDDVVPLRPRGPAALSWRRVAPLALAASLLIAVGLGLRDRVGGRGPTDGGDVDVARGDASGAVMLITPEADDTTVVAGAPVTFAWRPDPGAVRYVLEVLDADARVVIGQSTTDTVVTLRDVSRLTPGVEYRWWVRAVADGGPQRASPVRRLRVRSR